jgi:hypothetical protein
LVRNVYLWSDVETAFVRRAASSVYSRYSRFVSLEDLTQECYVWLYGKGLKSVNRWLANDPQQTTRISRELYACAQGYAQQEKALKLGYDISDVTWYSPSLVEALLPLALDSTYDGTGQMDQEDADNNHGGKSKKDPSEGGDVLAMVMDLRRAFKALPEIELELMTGEAGSSSWESGLMAVVNYLGGEKALVGNRKVISNAHAQALTTGNYDD